MYLVIKTEDEKNQILILRNQGSSYARITRKYIRGMCKRYLPTKKQNSEAKEKRTEDYISCGL